MFESNVLVYIYNHDGGFRYIYCLDGTLRLFMRIKTKYELESSPLHLSCTEESYKKLYVHFRKQKSSKIQPLQKTFRMTPSDILYNLPHSIYE